MYRETSTSNATLLKVMVKESSINSVLEALKYNAEKELEDWDNIVKADGKDPSIYMPQVRVILKNNTTAIKTALLIIESK